MIIIVYHCELRAYGKGREAKGNLNFGFALAWKQVHMTTHKWKGWFRVENPKMKWLDQMILVYSFCDKRLREIPDRLIAHLNHSNKVKYVSFF